MQQLSESAWELDCCRHSRRLSCGGYDITFFVICMKIRVRLTDVQHSCREWAKSGKIQELAHYVKSEALEGSRSLAGFWKSERKPLESVLVLWTGASNSSKSWTSGWWGESWSVDKSWPSWEESPNSRWKSQERSARSAW